jgi:hypothetical protein
LPEADHIENNADVTLYRWEIIGDLQGVNCSVFTPLVTTAFTFTMVYSYRTQLSKRGSKTNYYIVFLGARRLALISPGIGVAVKADQQIGRAATAPNLEP